MDANDEYILAFVNSTDESFSNFALFTNDNDMIATVDLLKEQLDAQNIPMYSHYIA